MTSDLYKGATSEGAKGAEAPPLAKLQNKIKYLTVLNILCLSDMKLRDLIYDLKIDCDTVKLQKVTYNVTKIFHF